MKKKYFLSRVFILTSSFIVILTGLNACKSDNDNQSVTKDSTKTGKIKNEDINKRVTIEITGKELQHGDPKIPSDTRDYIALTCKITNNASKEIKQVEADMMINDLAGNELKKVTISYLGSIPVKGNIEYRGLYSYNAFNEKEVMLKSVDAKSIKIDVNIVRIGYRDGTFETLLVN